MYWTLQSLKDSENKQQILHCSSILSAATVCLKAKVLIRHMKHQINCPPGLAYFATCACKSIIASCTLFLESELVNPKKKIGVP
jgi:hypothetical protein